MAEYFKEDDILKEDDDTSVSSGMMKAERRVSIRMDLLRDPLKQKIYFMVSSNAQLRSILTFIKETTTKEQGRLPFMNIIDMQLNDWVGNIECLPHCSLLDASSSGAEFIIQAKGS